MTQRFLKAMPYVFEHEGGYNNVKGDLGGATNWGISLRFLQGLGKEGDVDGDGDVDWLDIQKLSKQHAEELYFDNFWKNLYDKVSERLGIKMFDTGINMGTVMSNKLLQRALNALGSKLVTDGMVGQTTLGELVKYTDVAVLNSYCNMQKNYYDAIITAKPEQVKFQKGWYKRAMWLPA